jgi:hypothetical protein
MRFTHTLLFATAAAFYLPAMAQPADGSISGKVTDPLQKPVAAASVFLLRLPDSARLGNTITDSMGIFVFETISAGQYTLRISASGYKEQVTTLTHETGIGKMEAQIPALEPSTNELGNVTVVGRRPPIEVTADKTLVNVEAILSNTGATALEVLEKSPGVTVDRDGNISLRGRTNPLVMIDGKPTFLSPADLVNLLNTMNAAQLDQIELMTNPPAKYDAVGNAGVINIKTKKNRQRGFNGSASAAYNQGRYASGNGSLNLNYRNGKFNVFGNYNYNRNNGFSHLTINRGYLGNDNVTYVRNFEQPSHMRNQGHTNTFKLGADYYLNKKTTIGMVAGGFHSPRAFDALSTGYWKNAAFVIDSSTKTISDNNNLWQNATVNFNLRHEIDKTSELTADLDYVRYDMENQQLFTNENYDAFGSLLYSDQIRGELPASINIFSAKADYSKSLKGTLKTEAGIKTSHVNTSNLALYSNRILPNGNWTPDYEISNHFTYEENIHAAYGNIKGESGKWEWQTGLRLEHTRYDGYQAGNPAKDDSAFSNQYTSLFPTGFLSYKIDSIHTVTLNAGRRIQRPAYQQLNPFKFFINEYTYQEGNPYLQPQFSNNVELTHSYKGKINTTLGYAYTTQVFSQIFRAEGEITILTEGNLGKSHNANLTLNINEQVTKWWNLNFTGIVNYLVVEGNNFGQTIESNAFNGNTNLNNQFKFGKGWSAELSGFYNTKSKDAQFTIAGFGQVSAGIGKQVLKNKGTIRLNARDIFWTQKIDGQIKYGNVREQFFQFRDSRVITLSLQYRFGKPMKDTNKKRNSGGATEEQNRVQAG